MTEELQKYRPLLPEENITPARAETLADQILRKALSRVNQAVQKGRFEIQDLEAILAACLATTLQAGEKTRVRAKIGVVSNLVRSLTGVIKSREELEIQRETAAQVASIEAKIEKIKDATEKGN